MNDQDKIAEQAAEIDRLGLVLAERQAKIGKLMGEAARAGIAGAPVRGAGEVLYLIELLNAIKPNFGDVGSRDVEVKAQRERIEEAIAILSAAPAAPSEQVEPIPSGWLADLKAINRAMQHMGDTLNNMDAVEGGDEQLAAPGFEAIGRLLSAAAMLDAAPAPAAPLPELTGPSAILAKTAHMDDFNQSSVPSYAQFLAWAIWRDNYKEISPDFEIMADTWGVLSQIDNMVCGMALKPAASPSLAPAPQQELSTPSGVPEDCVSVPVKSLSLAVITLAHASINNTLYDEAYNELSRIIAAHRMSKESVETAAPGASIGGDPEDRARSDEDWFFSPNDG